jgi:hypothetical protein
MKKIAFIALLSGICIIQQSFGQAPVGFPDGITVGIGASIPSGSPYKLAVRGGIITEKVRVAGSTTPDWADYVFDPSFKLRTLKEVENFIQLNKHLPDIPSTSEVTQNGIDIGETQALLLQKIEELTLYLIEQNKKIERLERKYHKLRRKN